MSPWEEEMEDWMRRTKDRMIGVWTDHKTEAIFFMIIGFVLGRIF